MGRGDHSPRLSGCCYCSVCAWSISGFKGWQELVSSSFNASMETSYSWTSWTWITIWLAEFIFNWVLRYEFLADCNASLFSEDIWTIEFCVLSHILSRPYPEWHIYSPYRTFVNGMGIIRQSDVSVLNVASICFKYRLLFQFTINSCVALNLYLDYQWSYLTSMSSLYHPKTRAGQITKRRREGCLTWRTSLLRD